MDTLWTAARFVASIAMYYIKPTPPDFVLIEATVDDEDVTAEVIAWLALGGIGRPKGAEGKRLVVRYKYCGSGPFAYYAEKDEDFFFPPLKDVAVKCLENCVTTAEITRDDELVADVTDIAVVFAAPDGKWHGRTLDKDMDLRLLCKDIKKGDLLTIIMADNKSIEITF